MKIYTAAKKISALLLAGMLITAAAPQAVYAQELENEVTTQSDADSEENAGQTEKENDITVLEGEYENNAPGNMKDQPAGKEDAENVDDNGDTKTTKVTDDIEITDNTEAAGDAETTDADNTQATENTETTATENTETTDDIEVPEDTEGTYPDGTTGAGENLPGEIAGDPSGIGGSSAFLQEDPATGIIADAAEAVFPAGTVLYVTSVESGEAYDQIGTLMSMIADRFKVYDIRFINMLDQSMTEPAGTVKISIPVPEGYDTEHLSVSRLGEDGTRTEMPFEITDGKALFETDAAGTFLIAQMKVLPESLEMTEKTERVELTKKVSQQAAGTSAVSKTSLLTSPKTGDDTDVAVWGGLMAAAVVVLLVFVVIKRKK